MSIGFRYLCTITLLLEDLLRLTWVVELIRLKSVSNINRARLAKLMNSCPARPHQALDEDNSIVDWFRILA